MLHSYWQQVNHSTQFFDRSQYAKSVFDRPIATPITTNVRPSVRPITRLDFAKTRQVTQIIITPPDSLLLQLEPGIRLSLSDAVFDAKFHEKTPTTPGKTRFDEYIFFIAAPKRLQLAGKFRHS
jgi:hypothetical protein